MNVIKQHANNLRAFSDSRISWNSANLLERMADLLSHAKCPNDCENGFYAKEVPGYDGEPDIDVVECDFCYERDRLLKDNHR